MPALDPETAAYNTSSWVYLAKSNERVAARGGPLSTLRYAI